jgi:acyl-CoA reductase-like NAD-dependent aldehyde dehydrogenase
MDMLINGKSIAADCGETIDVFNPANGELVDSVPRGKSADVEKAVRAAKKGFTISAGMPARIRANILEKAGALLLDNLEDLKKTMIIENGKSHVWAEFEVRKSAEILKTVGDRAKDPQGTSYPMDAMHQCDGQFAVVYRQPRGIVGGIIPFNFPLEMFAYKAGGAFSAGNPIVVKLSEDCPLTCLKAGELMLKAGMPKECLHLISGYGEEAGEALVTHPDVPAISFTGSSEIGKHIMEKSARYLKHLMLELGGNDPVIVFEDADLDAVAENLIRGRMTVGNGQACVADKRFIVQSGIHDALLDKCVAVVQTLKTGNPIDPSVDVGPVIHEESAKKIEAMINDAVDKGAKVSIGGGRFNRTFIEPTIIEGITEQMLIAREECFGPVAPFIRFNTEEEALSIANNSNYGLQGAVYTKDISRAWRIADKMDVGGVVINASSCFRPGNVPYMPRKESGLGTDNMYNCYEEMTTGKAVVVNNAFAR